MRLILVKPRADIIVPMPSGLDLPPEGATVDADDLFWARRLIDGDVVEIVPEQAKAAVKKEAAL